MLAPVAPDRLQPGEQRPVAPDLGGALGGRGLLALQVGQHGVHAGASASSASPCASRSRARRAAPMASAHRVRSPAAADWAWPRRRSASASASVTTRAVAAEPGGLLPRQEGPAAADHAGRDQHRGRQRHGQPTPLPLPLGTGPGLGASSSATRRRFSSSSARAWASTRAHSATPQPLLHPLEVRGQPSRHLARGVRAPPRLGRQAAPGQADQLDVDPARVEPAQGIGQVAPRGPVAHLLAVRADVGRPAGEDLAEDRPQAEHVGALVDPLHLAPGLLGRHVRGGAQDAAGLRSSSVPAGPLRTVVMTACAADSSAMPPCERTLASPQSMTWTSPKDPTITFDGFRSRWTTPRAWA